MPGNLIEFNSAADYNFKMASIELTPGTLFSVVLYTKLYTWDTAYGFGEIAISNTLDNFDQRSAMLVSGSYGGIVSLHWTGNLPIKTNEFIVARTQTQFVGIHLLQIKYIPLHLGHSFYANKQ